MGEKRRKIKMKFYCEAIIKKVAAKICENNKIRNHNTYFVSIKFKSIEFDVRNGASE